MPTLRHLTAAALGATLAAAPATIVFAQDAQTAPETSQVPQSAPTSDFADEQIDAFANATFEMEKIQDKYAQKLQGVENETEQQDLLQQADTEMRATIEESNDLTVDDYLAINRAASTDQELNQRIAQRLQELQSEKPG